MTSPTRSYGGVAAAERSAQRRAALIEAGLDLYADGGERAVTKRATCQRARLNDRYFYEQFADSTALLQAICEELTGQGLTAVNAAVAAAPDNHPARIHAAASAAMAFLADDHRRAALLLGEYTTEPLRQFRLASIRQIAQSVSALSRNVHGKDARPQIDTDMTAYVFVSGTMELAAAWFRGEFAVSQEHLVDLLTTLLLSTAGVRPTS